MEFKNQNPVIRADNNAIEYLLKKSRFYSKRGRVPRIVLSERSCHGAIFRLFFDAPALVDIQLNLGDIDIYVARDLLDEFGGFCLDLEMFFFAQRIRISPTRQSFKCDCKSKCKNAAMHAASEDI